MWNVSNSDYYFIFINNIRNFISLTITVQYCAIIAQFSCPHATSSLQRLELRKQNIEQNLASVPGFSIYRPLFLAQISLVSESEMSAPFY